MFSDPTDRPFDRSTGNRPHVRSGLMLKRRVIICPVQRSNRINPGSKPVGRDPLMETSDSRTTPNESQSVSGSGVGQPSQTNPRQKKDIAWKHVTESTSSEGRKILTCDYCHTSFRGGGINRMKQHLAGEKGNVASCKKVPPEIRFMIQGSLKENVEKKQKKSEDL
ncbi:UNVERIFIED_CONTAM: hypothetical protein Scaly_2891500 [Sesamum calycinum]|uniref:BED-type domain-containing protein n=1 Tax=Sesamum calycinum TaxID=2727403 RepID=A0AAW2L890_9LAMI